MQLLKISNFKLVCRNYVISLSYILLFSAEMLRFEWELEVIQKRSGKWVMFIFTITSKLLFQNRLQNLHYFCPIIERITKVHGFFSFNNFHSWKYDTWIISLMPHLCSHQIRILLLFPEQEEIREAEGWRSQTGEHRTVNTSAHTVHCKIQVKLWICKCNEVVCRKASNAWQWYIFLIFREKMCLEFTSLLVASLKCTAHFFQ